MSRGRPFLPRGEETPAEKISCFSVASTFGGFPPDVLHKICKFESIISALLLHSCNGISFNTRGDKWRNGCLRPIVRNSVFNYGGVFSGNPRITSSVVMTRCLNRLT